jgi:dipeptidyl aminopeptidase/acylaminoacyl peptidase
MQGDVSQWAPNLYHDLADVTKWSVEQGYTNSAKTCLYGENYGGYIALMAAAKNEHAFKCVAAIGALTDINHHLFKSKTFVSYEQTIERFSSDSSVQSAFSPVSYAKSLLPSVLLAHGEDDSVLRSVQSEIMHDALKKHSKNSEFILIENEDSKFSTDASRIKVFTAIESFFAAQLQ